MTRGPPLKAEEGSVAAQEAELAKSAITNESRAQHYAMADYYTRLAEAQERLPRIKAAGRRRRDEAASELFVTQNEAIDRCRRPQNEHCPGGRVLVFAKGNCRPKKNFDPSVSQLDRYGPRAREPIIATPPVRVGPLSPVGRRGRAVRRQLKAISVCFEATITAAVIDIKHGHWVKWD
jgi:hypothetical protein